MNSQPASLIGLVIGLGAAALITFGSRREWIMTGGRRLATLAAALSSFALAVAVDGNGFITAFVAGISFGAALDHDVVDIEDAGELPELDGEVLALTVWFLFGAALVPVVFDHLDVPTAIYALLSLTLVRMVPVALCLVRAGLDRRTVLFVAWLGPRGLASVVFGLLAIEELGSPSWSGRLCRSGPHHLVERDSAWCDGRAFHTSLRPPRAERRRLSPRTQGTAPPGAVRHQTQLRTGVPDRTSLTPRPT